MAPFPGADSPNPLIYLALAERTEILIFSFWLGSTVHKLPWPIRMQEIKACPERRIMHGDEVQRSLKLLLREVPAREFNL
jgi:hypothetical protein